MLSGTLVTDKRTGLVWARCSVGQSWNGSTCNGSASLLTHEVALQHAAGQSGWRLPNVKELASLVDEGCRYPTIDVTAFPGTLSEQYWSSTPYTLHPEHAWPVHFGNGEVLGLFGDRSLLFAVRLVRVGQ